MFDWSITILVTSYKWFGELQVEHRSPHENVGATAKDFNIKREAGRSVTTTSTATTPSTTATSAASRSAKNNQSKKTLFSSSPS